MNLPLIDGWARGWSWGNAPVIILMRVFLAHRCASLQHDCWMLMEDGVLVLGMGHLAECVHDPGTHAHLDPQLWMGLAHIFRILGSPWCSMAVALG